MIKIYKTYNMGKGGAMDLSQDQRRLLKSADSDGRVEARPSREVEEMVEKGYLEESAYCRGFYTVCKNEDGTPRRR